MDVPRVAVSVDLVILTVRGSQLSALVWRRNAAPHLEAMRRLPNWCDEASYIHWEQRATQLPPIDDVYLLLRNQGITSKVSHPTAAHAAGQTTSSKKPHAR